MPRIRLAPVSSELPGPGPPKTLQSPPPEMTARSWPGRVLREHPEASERHPGGLQGASESPKGSLWTSSRRSVRLLIILFSIIVIVVAIITYNNNNNNNNSSSSNNNNNNNIY